MRWSKIVAVMKPWLPAAVAAVALAAAALSGRWTPEGILARPHEMLVFLLLGALSALHRPLPGPGSFGLATMILPAAVVRLGALPAAVVAGLAHLIAELWHRRSGTGGRGAGAAERALFVAGAAVLAGALYLPDDAVRAAAATAAYLCALLLFFAARAFSRPERSASELAEVTAPADLALDAAGWGVGFVLVLAAEGAGWGVAAVLGAVLALAVAESARLAALRLQAELRLADVDRLRQAHRRILAEISGLGGIAQQVLTECLNILPLQWFQFELLHPDGESQSFSAGPDGVLVEGEPQPAARPPALPGVHRRASWHVVEGDLVVEDEALAVVRAWCDPRRLDPEAEELFRSLLPLMASSLHRARLDREAKLDPLTGVPVRRMLERRLQQAYRQCCEEGTSMAVILCDIDHFKKINDTYGHAAGDAALVAFSQTLEAHRREADLCCRYGGEEFTLLCEATTGVSALGLAERLRLAVEALDFQYEGTRIPLTMSLGVASFPELYVKTSSELLLLADEALYAAKQQGRNRSLLNLGRGAFRAPAGRTVGARDAAPAEAPRIFG